MKNTSIIFILIFAISCTDVNTLVEEIAKDEMMESQYIGFAGTKSEQYQNFEKLNFLANDDKLNNLRNHINPIIRTFAYQSLIERELMKPSEAFSSAFQNNQSFSKMSGCQILGTDICTQIYFETLNFYPNSKKEIEQMDSLILFKMEENHFLQFMALKDKKHEEIYNERIINLALNHQNSSAIFYIVDHKLEIENLKFIESIKATIKKGGIGTEPEMELNKILKSLNTVNTHCETVFEYGEEMPKFKEGDFDLHEYSFEKLAPLIGESNKRTGNLITKLKFSLLISKEGKIIECSVLSNVDLKLKNDLVKELKKMPDWNPGKVNGQNVCMNIIVPISCMNWE